MSPEAGAALGAALLTAGAVGLFAALKQHATPLVQPIEARKPPPELRPGHQIVLKTGTQLIADMGLQAQLNRLRTLCAFTPENFNEDVLPLVHAFAEFVQALPASESHHHAQPGGLLEHSLEVAINALTQRQGMKLPVGGKPEDQIRLASVWTYATLVAALLHDVGKPVSDLDVTLYGKDASTVLCKWSAAGGAMTKLTGASHYSVDFPPPSRRDYQAHAKLPVMLVHALVPPRALAWLSQGDVLNDLMSFLGGQAPESAAITTMVKQADQQSVASNLATGSRIRFASAKAVPLIERLMLGLRELASGAHVAVNRPGAALFVDQDRAHVWAVAGTVADKTREVLGKIEVHEAGAAGLPSDNTRFFDTWSEYGALVQPPKAFGKGSVWWVRIETDDWNQVLTCLKFPIEALFPGDAPRPEPFMGRITPTEPTQRDGGPQTPAATEPTHTLLQPDKQEDVETDPAPTGAQGPDETWTSNDEGWKALMAAPSASAALPPPPVAPDPPGTTQDAPADEQEFLDAADSATTLSAPVLEMPRGTPVQAMKSTPKALYRLPGAKARPNADAFMAWVQTGLGNGELNYNESDALVHFVEEGMALVTPKIFRTYLLTHQFVGDVGLSKDPLRALQQEVQKGGYIARNPTEKTSFHYYRVERDGAEGAVITCYLVPNPQAYIRPVPSPNPLLKRHTKTAS